MPPNSIPRAADSGARGPGSVIGAGGPAVPVGGHAATAERTLAGRTADRRWKALAVSSLAMILVAAANEFDSRMDRLRSLPPDQRSRLLDQLRKFDLTLSPEQQSAIRELDRRLSAMPVDQQSQYVSVLRRYHSWVNGLPENRQDELAGRAAGDRMALVRTLLKDRPIPGAETVPFLRMIEPAEFSPFEVASAYKIWQDLAEKERSDLERKTPDQVRRRELFRIGAKSKHNIPREIVPPGFDEEHWVGLVGAQWGGLRPPGLLDPVAKAKLGEVAKKGLELLRPESLRREAINLYVSQTDLGSVDSERLGRFIAALPPWLPPTFDPLAPDEARRRMAFAYRLVFPKGEEIGTVKKASGDPTRARSEPAPRNPGRRPANPKPGGAGDNTAPF